MQEIKDIFSQKLKNAMFQLELTQEKLAKMCDVKQQTVGEWVKGDCLPSLSTFRKLCIQTKIDPNYFLDLHWKKEKMKKKYYELPGLTD